MIYILPHVTWCTSSLVARVATVVVALSFLPSCVYGLETNNIEKICNYSNSSLGNRLSSCTVLYNETITLICPSEGYWTRNNTKKILGHSTRLTLPQEGDSELHYWDRGVYLCDTNNVINRFYYFNITILGPPEFITVGKHTYVPYSRRYAMITADPSDLFVTVPVQVVGYGGPFEVFWRYNDSESDPCKNNGVNCVATLVNETSMIYNYTIKNLKGSIVSGWYTTTVSNRYGTNSAKTFVLYRSCAPPSYDPVRIKPSERESLVYLPRNGVLSLPCVATMPSINDLGICYSMDNETFDSVYPEKLYERCVRCSSEGCYNYIQNFTTTVNKINGECYQRGIVLNITDDSNQIDIQAITNLTFYCYWYANSDEYETFGQYEVRLQTQPSNGHRMLVLEASVSSTVVLVIIIVAAIAITLACVIKVKRKKRSRRRTSDLTDEDETTPLIREETSSHHPRPSLLIPYPINSSDTDHDSSDGYGSLIDQSTEEGMVMYVGSPGSVNTNHIHLASEPNSSGIFTI